MSKSKTICIVGAGTAGALCSAIIAVKRPTYKVINIRSATIPTIQVGESTTPLFLKLLKELGILEDFYKDTEAYPKHGVKFKDWFDNTFVAGWPIGGPYLANFAFLYGLANNKHLGSLDETVDEGKILYSPDKDSFHSITALHIDAQETYSYILNKFKDKITSIVGNVVKVNRSGNNITSIILDNNEEIYADEWIDCTGLKRLLINTDDFIESPIPINSAVAGVITSEDRPKDTWTVSTAATAGWIWLLSLKSRTGAGYLFHKDFISHEEAEKELQETIGYKINSFNRLSFTPGYLKNSKKGNTTAIGLSAGFVDALEATGLHVTGLQLNYWLDCEGDTDAYNKLWLNMFTDLEKYILFYYTTCVKQSKYWDSIVTLTDEEVYKKFEEILVNQDTFNHLTGFTNSIVLRLFANRIKYNKNLFNFMDTKLDMDQLLKSAIIVDRLSKNYQPYSDELFIKWLNYTGSLHDTLLAR